MLESADKQVKRFVIKGQYTGKVVDVYDGDTVQIVFQLCPCVGLVRYSCRLQGYNSAEIKSKSVDEQNKAIIARNELRHLLLGEVVQFEALGFEKYGRLLVDIKKNDINISDHMINSGFGKPYVGRGVKPV